MKRTNELRSLAFRDRLLLLATKCKSCYRYIAYSDIFKLNTELFQLIGHFLDFSNIQRINKIVLIDRKQLNGAHIGDAYELFSGN